MLSTTSEIDAPAGTLTNVEPCPAIVRFKLKAYVLFKASVVVAKVPLTAGAADVEFTDWYALNVRG